MYSSSLQVPDSVLFLVLLAMYEMKLWHSFRRLYREIYF